MSYRKTLEQIRIRNKQKKSHAELLYKSMSKKTHPIHDQKPHFIFSAENPFHPTKHSMSHEETMDFLDVRGYDVEEMQGKYGDHERSILVKNPKPHHFKHLKQLASDLGQDSSIVSDGYNHEIHFHHGDQAGNHVKGQGSNMHRFEPADNYSTLDDGTHFTHNFNFDEYHSNKDSFAPDKSKESEKEGHLQKTMFLEKSEDEHLLSGNSEDLKMIHYSPKQGLTELDPSYQGSRLKDSSSKQGSPEHPMNFFYLEGTKPENLVTSGAKSKYITSVGDKKLYDRESDTDGIGRNIHESLQKEASNRQMNPGVVSNEEFNSALHSKLKDLGFHGIYNSGLDETMRNVVGLFGNVQIEKEHPIHPSDFEKASARNFHGEDESLKQSKIFTKEKNNVPTEGLKKPIKRDRKSMFNKNHFSKKKEEVEKDVFEKSELAKGSFQRRNKFNPKEISEGEHNTISQWQQDASSNRSDISRLEGSGRERAMKKLASMTDVRTKDGKRHYLLHRGMEDQEHDSFIDRKGGKTNYQGSEYSKTNSWTPSYTTAKGFAADARSLTGKKYEESDPVSAWISEDDIHHYLPQAGSTSGGQGGDHAPNEYQDEHEVIVNHTKQHHLANPKAVELTARRHRDTDDKDAGNIVRMRQMNRLSPESANIERNRRINSRVAPKSNKKTNLRNEVLENQSVNMGGSKDEMKQNQIDGRLFGGVPNKLAASEKFDNDLNKGVLKDAIKTTVVGAAMASGAHQFSQPEPTREPASIKSPTSQEKVVEVPKKPTSVIKPTREPASKPTREPASIKPILPKTDGSENKHHVLDAISDIESSGGKNTNHSPLPKGGIHQGESAMGSWGLTPLLIRETIKKHPDLMKQYGHLSNYKGQLFREGMNAANKDGKLEKEIASRHYDRLAKQFGHDPAKIAYSWLNGVTGTHRAIRRGMDINNHWHAKKVVNAYNKRKHK